MTKRFRAIFGADEESGFHCMDHYFDVAKEEMPTMGFTPDGRFPVIYAEKGIAKPIVAKDWAPQTSAVKLTGLSAGQRSNMVPDRAFARLEGWDDQLTTIAGQLFGVQSISVEQSSGLLNVTATGVSAHASTPHLGTSAIMVLTDALMQLDALAEIRSELQILNNWASNTTGKYLGIEGSEEITGALTSNLGILTFNGTTASATFSIRHPVTWTGADIRSRIESYIVPLGYKLTLWDDYSNPLYVPLDSPLISTLLEVYRAETGDMSEPATMGGGTYAKVLKCGVAFGPNFPGFPDNAHQAEEYWTVEDLIKATKIYAKALARLGMQGG